MEKEVMRNSYVYALKIVLKVVLKIVLKIILKIRVICSIY